MSDVMISCYAGGRPSGVPDTIRVIDWPGYHKTPKSHPTWGKPALALRAADGRLLPALLKKYGASSATRVGVIGFSAGFGGVRELLRSPADRAALSAAIVIDSIHLPLKSPGVWDPSDPVNAIAAWSSAAEPFVSFMVEAAQGKKLWVSTWGDIPRPSESVTTAAEGNATLFRALLERVPYDPPPLPKDFPRDRSSAALKPGESHPVPADVWGSGNAFGLYYPTEGKSLSALKRSHVLQAKVISADVWRDLLVPWWGGSSAPPSIDPASFDGGPVARGPSSAPTPAARAAARLERSPSRTSLGVVALFGAGLVWEALRARHDARRF